MRRIVNILSAVMTVAVIAVSCRKCQDIPSLMQMKFNASYHDASTRTILSDGKKVLWEPGDMIAVSGASEPFVTDITSAAASAVFSGQAIQSEVYYAAYPYSSVKEWADEVVLLELPAVQNACAGTFASGTNITVSSTTDQQKNFRFHNVLGYVKFSVGALSGDITSVTVSAPGGEPLSGEFYADCSQDSPAAEPASDTPSSVTLTSDTPLGKGDYYIALLPGTYSEGLTFFFEGPDGLAVRKIESSLALAPGNVSSIGTISGLDWEKPSYRKVTQNPDDWSGEYLITYSTSSTVKVFDSFSDTEKGASKTDLGSYLSDDCIPAEYGDPVKAVIKKVGEKYSIYITGVGYIGLESSANKVHKSSAEPTASSTKYLWSISCASGGSVSITNASYSGRILMWNSSASCFRCYTSGQKLLTLYKRTVPSELLPDVPDTPSPDPEEPEPDPEDPDPTPEPTPDPVPGASGKYGWYELPVMNIKESGSYLVDKEDSDLYYAYHLCAGNEKGPGGSKARNYTVCFSAEHHCPVWVAAPRHKMYESGVSRTDAYAKDPDIPADIQYNSKSTGGSCNKGHMLGSAERLSSTATNRQVFYYSNIAPQYTNTFNTGGGGWNTLEDWVDKQVCSDTLYVVIGTYFKDYTDRRGYSDSPKTISFGGRNDVTRPSMFYYILMRTKSGNTGKPLSECTASEIKCAAFVRSHATPKGVAVSEKDLMSVSDLEKLTGFTYFPNVPQAPKDSYKASDWGL